LQEQLYDLKSEVYKIDTSRTLQHEQNVERLEKVEKILAGNGQPGLVTMVTEINTTLSVLGKLVLFVVVPLLAGTIGTVLWDHFTKSH